MQAVDQAAQPDTQLLRSSPRSASVLCCARYHELEVLTITILLPQQPERAYRGRHQEGQDGRLGNACCALPYLSDVQGLYEQVLTGHTTSLKPLPSGRELCRPASQPDLIKTQIIALQDVALADPPLLHPPVSPLVPAAAFSVRPSDLPSSQQLSPNPSTLHPTPHQLRHSQLESPHRPLLRALPSSDRGCWLATARFRYQVFRASSPLRLSRPVDCRPKLQAASRPQGPLRQGPTVSARQALRQQRCRSVQGPRSTVRRAGAEGCRSPLVNRPRPPLDRYRPSQGLRDRTDRQIWS